LAGGYCLDDGIALIRIGKGVWECPKCGRRSPEIAELEDGMCFDAVCDRDGASLEPIRGDILHCPKCGKRRLKSLLKGDRPPATAHFERHWQSCDPLRLPYGSIHAMTVTKKGEVWIGYNRCCIGHFPDSSREFVVLSTDEREFGYLHDVVTGDDGTICFVGSHRGCIHVYHPDDLKWEHKTLGGLRRPVGLAIDGIGTSYVLETGGARPRVRIFDQQSGTTTVEMRELREPSSIALTSLRRGQDILIMDPVVGRLVCISRKGQAWWQTPAADEPSAFLGACSMACSSDGNWIVVASTSSQQLVFLDAIGEVIGRLETDFRPSCITLSTDACTMYVGDEERGLVWPFERCVESGEGAVNSAPIDESAVAESDKSKGTQTLGDLIE